MENVKDGGPSALSLRVHLVPPHVAWCASGGQTSGQELGAPPTRPRSVPPFPQAFQITPSLLPPTVHEARPEHMASAAPAPPWGLESEVGLPPAARRAHVVCGLTSVSTLSFLRRCTEAQLASRTVRLWVRRACSAWLTPWAGLQPSPRLELGAKS